MCTSVPFAKGRDYRPVFNSLSKSVLELLRAAQSLKEKFGTCLQKRIVSYELRVEGLALCTSFTRRHLNQGES